MNYFSKKRLAFWGIVLLVIMNVSSLATVWWQQHRLPGPPRDRGRGPVRVLQFMKKKLGLTETQVKQFAQLQREHFQQARAIQGAILDLKHEFLGELSASSPDEAKVERLAEEIGRKQTELEKLTFYHFLDLKNVCTPEQQIELNTVFGNLLRKMTPPPQPPPQGRPRPAWRQ